MTNSLYTAWNITIHLCMVIFGWSNLGSIPICAPLFTATPLQQVANVNGTLPGKNFKRSPLPVKPKSCALRWPAQRSPGCSTGQLIDNLNTIALHLTAHHSQLLTCTHAAYLLFRYLEYTLNSSLIRKQDATSTIIYIANNVVGQPLAWDFVRAQWSYIFTQ